MCCEHTNISVYIFTETVEQLVTVCLCCLLAVRAFQHSFCYTSCWKPFRHWTALVLKDWCELVWGEWKGNQARRIFNRAGSKMGKPQPSTHDMSQLTSPSRLSRAAREDSKTSSVSWYSIESSSWDMLHFEVFLQTRTRHGFFTTRKSVQGDKMLWRAYHFRRTHKERRTQESMLLKLLKNVKGRDNNTDN
jgi:hypothetical protein